MYDSIKYNADKISEIAKKIAVENGISIEMINNTDEMNKLISEAIRRFDMMKIKK